VSAEEVKPTEKPKAEGEAPPPAAPRSRKGLKIGTAALSLVALGGALSMLAVPKKHGPVTHTLHGPTLLAVSPPSGFHVNLAGGGGKNYLAVTVMAEVDAFDEAKVTERAGDALYKARISDAVLKTASRKKKSDLDDAVDKEVFRQELRTALEEVLFPIHVGNPEAAGEHHSESGLGAGTSIDKSTMRGSFFDHVLTVDAAQRTIQLDAGEVQSFEGGEHDLEVRDANGDRVFVDVSALEPGFSGKVPVGALGVVRKVYFTAFLIQ
jgi:flagellar basal body-associated protein FliL